MNIHTTYQVHEQVFDGRFKCKRLLLAELLIDWIIYYYTIHVLSTFLSFGIFLKSESVIHNLVGAH